MTFSRTTTVEWNGSIMEGGGTAKAGTGAFSLPVSFPRRIGAPEGTTSPEELVAAAHATCYAMVVAGALGRANASTKRTSVTCTITADKGDAGIRLTHSKIELAAEGLTGMDAAAFDKLAQDALGKCPISIALSDSIEKTVVATVK